MLGLLQHHHEMAQAELHLVALVAQARFLVALDGQGHLHVLHRVVALFHARLGILFLREILTGKRELLLLLLLLLFERIDALDGLAHLELQVLELLLRRLDLRAHRLIDIKELRLVVLDCRNRIVQDLLERRIARELQSLCCFRHKLPPFLLFPVYCISIE